MRDPIQARERGVILRPHEVRGVLDGRQSQFRRPVKPQPKFNAAGAHNANMGGRNDWWDFWAADRAEIDRRKSSYAPGDLLFVKERWRPVHSANPSQGAEYRADWPAEWRDQTRWRHAGHMPRWASRITIRITDVRVERLNEISASDSLAEGIECQTCKAMQTSACGSKGCFASIVAYRDLWEQLNGPHSWAANPFVWVITFERVPQPNDVQGGER